MWQLISLLVRVWSSAVTALMQVTLLFIGLSFVLYCALKLWLRISRRGEKGFVHVAFFHPYCNAGGGGERVLWCAIRALQHKYPSVKCYVYTGDCDTTSLKIIAKAHQRFNITLLRPVEFIFLRTRTLVEARHYKYMTLLMQSIGSVALALEALGNFVPDVYLDTMGYAFTYPVFSYLGGCSVGCYTHYPTISTDMLSVVAQRMEAHNNRPFIARSRYLSAMKMSYYRVFAQVYGVAGRCAQVVMVNSTWTQGHISALWHPPGGTRVVFPPCDTEKFAALVLIPDEIKEMRNIVSIGQFRPEKNHSLQLRSFKRLMTLLSEEDVPALKLVLVGGCRDMDDENRVATLKAEARELGLEEQVEWRLNVSFGDLLECVRSGTIGIHTMWNEHFGIGVVEGMAGGLITVANDSGGPKLDIVTDYDGQKTGFLASDEDSYAAAMAEVLAMDSNEREAIRQAGKRAADRFCTDKFETAFLEVVEELIMPHI